MEVYMTNTTSRACVCGGKCSWTPSIKARHEVTLKHRNWRFERLCEAMLNEALTHAEKRMLLRESKAVLCP